MAIKIYSSILVAFPFILVSGSFLTNLSVTLLGLYYIFSLNKEEAKVYLNNVIVKLILAFWIYCLLRSLFSANYMLSLESSLFYGRFIFFSLGTALLINQNNKIILYFGISLWACLLLLTFDGYLQFLTGENIFGWKKWDPLRISSFFGDELVLGQFIARLMPLAFFFISFNAFKNKSLLILLGLILLVLQDVLIFLAGERTAFMLLILGSVMIILLVPNFRVIRITTFSISCILIILIVNHSPEVKTRMIDQTLDGMGISNANQDVVIFSQGHQDHYMTAISMFLDRPIVGHGPKMFRQICKDYDIYLYSCATHPHNTYIQLLAELGLLGTLPVICIFFYIAFILTRHLFFLIIKKNKFIINDYEIFLLVCFTITLWPLAPTFSFFTSWINAIYYLPLGFYLYQIKKR